MKKMRIFLLFLLLLGMAPKNTVASEVIPLKIAYIQNYGVIKTPRINGYEGYGYEYLYKILEYTQNDYQLEFIETSLSEGLKRLQAEEVDLLLPLAFSEKYTANFIYSKENFGREVRFLSSTNPDYVLTGDYHNFNQSTIAVQKDDVILDSLYEFLEQNKLKAQIKEMEITSFHDILFDNTYDFVLASSYLMDSKLSPAFILDSMPTYILATERNQSILEDLDQGIQRIQTEEFMFQERTYLKYFDTDYNLNSHISSSDYEFLKFKSIYQVGLADLNSAMSQVNADGEPIGIYKDILDQIALDIGVQFQYTILDQDTDPEIFAKLDFSALAFGDEARLTFMQSDPLLQIPFQVVSLRNLSADVPPFLGTLDYYDLAEEDINFFTPFSSVQTYETPLALQKAFVSGEINSMFLTSAELNLMNLDGTNFTTKQLEYFLSPSISYGENFPKTKIEIINKFIARLDPAELEVIVTEHSQPEDKNLTVSEILEENPIILQVFFSLLALIFLAILYGERSKKKALLKMLNTDEITGLFTEHHFLAEVRAILDKNPKKQYSIVSIDIDNFKYINEVYGYESGTKVLQEVSNFLKDLTPPVLMSRGNSDVFIFFLETGSIAQQIEESLEYDSILVPQCNKHLSSYYHFTLSMGMYHAHDPSLKVNYMVDCANSARCLGKGIMSNTFFQFTENMRHERANTNEILSQTEKAMSQQEFVMYYQPKIQLQSQKLTGTEALVRWIRNGKVVPPNDFIPLFEKNGFIEKLDYYVLDSVCQFIAQNREKKLPRISVNLSGFSAIRENLVENLMEVLERHQVSPCEIDIEITESAFVENFERAVSKLDFLRELGFTISMDDFGAGISSLGRLKEIPIDILKIDREFIVDSLENEKGATIILNIVRMAKDLKVETVAEGIETQEQLDFLRNLGCDVGQGYFFNKPLPQHEFLQALEKNRIDFP